MLISRYQDFLTKGDNDMNDIIGLLVVAFIIAPVVFCALFIVFLVISINRGKRIKELENEIKALRSGNGSQPAQQPVQTANNPVMIPNQMAALQNPQPEFIRLPDISSQGYMPPVQQAAPQAPYVSRAPQQAYEPQAAAEPEIRTEIPGQAATPSWAVPPSQVAAVRAEESAAQTRIGITEQAQKKKSFSSINITFGIGVLLLTIVGATFMTGSWPWMTEGFRTAALIFIVVMVYGMSFLAGKVLKLQQTEFAMYSLASLLGPIVIVGIGAFNLLGSAFSFKNGSGWLVATVAATVLVVSSVGGRFLFRDEKNQSNVYQGTFYIALTWLVVFLSAQIGQASGNVGVWSMICLGLATMALVFRIIAITGILKNEAFFKVYSEIITYIPAGLLVFSVFIADGAVFGATIVEFIVFILYAKFTEGRTWVRYLTPFVGMLITASWVVFGDSEEAYLITSVVMTIIFLLYVVHKITGISSWLSDIGLTVALGAVTTVFAVEEVHAIGAAACFLTLIMLIFQMVIEPMLAKRIPSLNGIFRDSVPLAAGIILSLLSTVFYYGGMTMIFLSVDHMPFKGHLFFTLSALVPVIASIIVRAVWKDDIRIRMAGMLLSVISVISGLISCCSFDVNTDWYMHIDLCSVILTLAVITMSVFFVLKPFKERKISIGPMFWISLCVNSPAIAVFMIIGHRADMANILKTDTAYIFEDIFKIAAVSFIGLNIAALIAAFILKRKGKEFIAGYSAGIKYFFTGFAMSWFILSWILIGTDRVLLIVAVIFAVLLSLFDAELFAVLPVVAAEICLISEFGELNYPVVNNILCIASALVFAAAGRLVFRKNTISDKAVDYLSFTSFIFLFGLDYADYVPLMVFLTLALLVLNLAGRIKIPARVLVSVFASLICMTAVVQPFFSYPDIIELEINILLMLGTLLLICKVIRPAPENTMKYIWFTGVALSIVAEGVSAAVTGEALDLIIVGTASFGIFIYAFIRRNRLWFILGIVSMISIAVYLSLAFWSSLVWLVYLLVCGIILIVMASVNEWGKRHSKDGKKRRFFEEWTW